MINVYPTSHDGDVLAAKANTVLENYKSHARRVLRTNSVSRTPNRPAEYFVAVVFGRPDFLEAAFARFKLVDGASYSRQRSLVPRLGFLRLTAFRLAIAALAAIACLAIIHRAIFAARFARGLVRCQRSRADHGRDNRTHNFGVSLHINLNRA